MIPTTFGHLWKTQCKKSLHMGGVQFLSNVRSSIGKMPFELYWSVVAPYLGVSSLPRRRPWKHANGSGCLAILGSCVDLTNGVGTCTIVYIYNMTGSILETLYMPSLYITGTCLSFVFGGLNPPKEGLFAIKTRVIWVPGSYTGICW